MTKTPLAALLAAALFALFPAQAQQQAQEQAQSPSEIVAAAPAEEWRPVEPQNLLIVRLANGAAIHIELAPYFAPRHAQNIRTLARAGWYDGASVYRVQDNYVAQWGTGETDRPLPDGVEAVPAAEYATIMDPDMADLVAPVEQGGYAERSGYFDGWPVGLVSEEGETSAALVHCYAMVGVGRGEAPDTGSGSDLYAVIGHAPRHLDRNIALVGRVIDGIEHLSTLPRGTGPLGFYEDEAQNVPIASARLAVDMPEADRPRFEVLRTETETFRRYAEARANRSGWFVRPAGAVDVCNVLLPIRRAS